MRPKTGIRLGAWALAVCLCVTTAMPGGALADPQAAPLSQKGTLSGTVRVYLSSLSGINTLSLTVDGSYTAGGESVSGSAKVSYESGQLYLTVGGAKRNMGQQFFLRKQSGTGIKIAQARNPANWYNGDMEFAIRNGKLYPIAHVYMEHYLYGVLPYEMGSAFPLEALKAQAVAARTYTVKAMQKNAAYYDVVDTTTDQVYRGLGTGIDKFKQAVNETGGVVAMYNGAYVGGYYTATNGGQTEAVKNIWGGSAYPYLGVQDDPYDLANSASNAKYFMINASGSGNGAMDGILRGKAAAQLGTSSGAVTITNISDVRAHSPMYPAPSRLYTKLDVSMTANGVPVTVTLDFFSELKSQLGLGMNSTKSELLSVDRVPSGFCLVARRYGHGVGMSQRGAQQMANQGFGYREILGFYYPGCNLVQYSFTNNGAGGTDDIPDLPSATAAPQTPVDPSQSSATVTLSNPSSWLNLRNDPNTGAMVLAQLMHGQTLEVVSTDGTWCQVRYGQLTGYVMQSFLTFSGGEPTLPTDPASPADATATPDPGQATATPAPDQSGAYTVSVWLQDIGSKLNLRSAPSTSASILTRLSHGTLLEALAEEGAWLRVRYGFSEGYVMASYVMRAQGAPQATATPAPDGEATPAPSAPQEGGNAIVSVSPGTTLNLRLEPNASSKILTTMRSGELVQWKPYSTDWVQVNYGAHQGYAMRIYLMLQESAAQPTATPAPTGEATATPDPSQATATPDPSQATATPAPSQTAQPKLAIVNLADPRGKLNLRSAASGSAKVIGTVPNGEAVEVVQRGDAWTEARYYNLQGFLSNAYLLFAQGVPAAPSEPTMPPQSTPTPPQSTEAPASATQAPPAQQTLQPANEELVVVATSLNLRADASTSARRLAELPYGARLTVLQKFSGWYLVQRQNLTGYVAAEYVQRADAFTAVASVASERTQTVQTQTQAVQTQATQEPAPEIAQPTEPPQPTPAPQHAEPPSALDVLGVNEGIVKPLPGETLIQAYKEANLEKPCWKIRAEEVLIVLAYEGEQQEWCEVWFGEETCFVRTELLQLKLPLPID